MINIQSHIVNILFSAPVFIMEQPFSKTIFLKSLLKKTPHNPENSQKTLDIKWM